MSISLAAVVCRSFALVCCCLHIIVLPPAFFNDDHFALAPALRLRRTMMINPIYAQDVITLDDAATATAVSTLSSSSSRRRSPPITLQNRMMNFLTRLSLSGNIGVVECGRQSGYSVQQGREQGLPVDDSECAGGFEQLRT